MAALVNNCHSEYNLGNTKHFALLLINTDIVLLTDAQLYKGQERTYIPYRDNAIAVDVLAV